MPKKKKKKNSPIIMSLTAGKKEENSSEGGGEGKGDSLLIRVKAPAQGRKKPPASGKNPRHRRHERKGECTEGELTSARRHNWGIERGLLFRDLRRVVRRETLARSNRGKRKNSGESDYYHVRPKKRGERKGSIPYERTSQSEREGKIVLHPYGKKKTLPSCLKQGGEDEGPSEREGKKEGGTLFSETTISCREEGSDAVFLLSRRGRRSFSEVQRKEEREGGVSTKEKGKKRTKLQEINSDHKPKSILK